MNDMRGMPIKEGDTVVYKYTYSSNVALSYGIVERFTAKNLYVDGRLKAPNTVLVINLPELPAVEVDEDIETPIEDAPWALKKKEGVRCKQCGDTSLKDKRDCMQNGCPYDLSGDDGMY